jgi:hypothetical protein
LKLNNLVTLKIIRRYRYIFDASIKGFRSIIGTAWIIKGTESTSEKIKSTKEQPQGLFESEILKKKLAKRGKESMGQASKKTKGSPVEMDC